MLYSFGAKINGYVNNKNELSRKIVKNVFLSFGVKVGSIAVGLLLVPMTIDYINPVQYGVWLTISSIITWMNFFDIGMGNGLRNKLAASLALKKYDEAKKYVSTTYALLALIAIGLFVFIFLVSPFIDWRGLLNIPKEVPDDIHFVVLIVLSSFCVQFVVQLINTVLTASHEPAKAALISFIGQLGVLIAVYFLRKTVPGSLSVLVLTLTLIPVLSLMVASLFFYVTKLKPITPSFDKIDFSYAKSILNIGGAFLILQLGAIVLYQTNSIIIAKTMGMEAVTEFNVAFRLFSIITMVFSIIITPYWSAFTEAYSTLR